MYVLAVTLGIIVALGMWDGLNYELTAGRCTDVRVTAALDGARIPAPLKVPSVLTAKPPPDLVLKEAGGALAAIRLFNQAGEELGYASGWLSVLTGQFTDFNIELTKEQQTAYLELEASEDAICIPMVTARWPDSSLVGWLGDWGKQCGLKWFVSDYFMSESCHYRPKCTWLDADGSNGIDLAKIRVHLPSFNQRQSVYRPSALWGPGLDRYCHEPVMRTWSKSDDGSYTEFHRRSLDDETSTQTRPWKRSVSKFQNQLVVSNREAHNATDLCLSPTSMGPSFVSLHEGLFCDMETRQLLPLCAPGHNATEDCFDAQEKRSLMKRSQGSRLHARDVALLSRSFEKVIEWTS